LIDTVYLNVKTIDFTNKNIVLYHLRGHQIEDKKTVDSIEINLPADIEPIKDGVRIYLKNVAYCEYYKGDVKKLRCWEMK